MVRNQEDASFVSWASSLHPESAIPSTDPRLDNASPWATIYSETFGGDDDSMENVPIAVQVVPLNETEDYTQQPHHHRPPEETPYDHDPESQFRAGSATEIDGSSNQNGNTTASRRPQPWKHSNLIDLILGFALTLVSFLCTIKIEIAAIVVYTIAAGCYFLGEEVFSATPLLLAKSICLTVTAALMIADAVLLTVSVVVTEVLGGVAFFLCAIFGGPRSGTEWHQFIRRACHMTRWGFRSCHKNWKPERIFPISMEVEQTVYQHQQHQQQNQDEEEEQHQSQRHHRSCPEEDHEGDDDDCLPLYYSDTLPPHSPSPSPTYANIPADDVSTLTDTARYTDSRCPGHPPPPPQASVAMVGPENVVVLGPEEGNVDPHFVKNTQQVVIT